MNQAQVGEKHLLTFQRAKEYAISLMKKRRLTEAKKALNWLIRKAEATLEKEDLFLLKCYEFYGLCLKAEKDYTRAQKTFKKVAKARE